MDEHAEVTRLPDLGKLSISVRPVMDLARSRLLMLGVTPRLEQPDGRLLQDEAIWSAAASSPEREDLSRALSDAIAQCWRGWSAQGLQIRMSIPVALSALQTEQMSRNLHGQLRSLGIPSAMLEFRIAERELADKVEQVSMVVRQIRQDGAGVAMGPCEGAGAQIGEADGLPFAALWICPASLAKPQVGAPLGDGKSDVHSAARQRGIPVIAQDVDTVEQLAMLSEGPWSGAQGDAIAPSMHPDDLRDWLQAQGCPVQPDEPASAVHESGDQDHGQDSGPQRSALIVDDDPLIRNMLKHQLAQLGIDDCDTAEDGAQAKEKVTSRPSYTVIFCDLQMPGVDGIEFLRFAAERIPQINVVLISSVDAKILRAAASLAQAHDLKLLGTLNKPVRLDTLRSLLERLERQVQIQAAGPGAPAALFDEAELIAAIEQRQIQPYFQPQLSVASGELMGAEALVRWPHPEGMRPPGAFLGQIQQAGLMPRLTQMMLEASLDALKSWQEHGLNTSVSVNVPMDVLSDLSFPERLSALCQQRGFSSDVIKLEITESSAMQDPVVTLDVVTRLRMRAFSLAIDDFGTGFSSLSQLREIPFNQLKIDQSFVSISLLDEEARHIVKSNIDLARSLEMLSVAEGVETADDWRLLRSLGCDLLQGFFASPALSVSDFISWVEGDFARRRAAGEMPPS